MPFQEPSGKPRGKNSTPLKSFHMKRQEGGSSRRIKKNRALISDNNMALDSSRHVVNKRRRRRRCAANESERKPQEWLAKVALCSTLCLKFATRGAEKNQMGHRLMWSSDQLIESRVKLLT